MIDEQRNKKRREVYKIKKEAVINKENLPVHVQGKFRSRYLLLLFEKCSV